MVYQLMFAIITPALITGAFAERMKFSAMAVFLSLWSLFVYSPMAHMVWGVGGLLNANGGHFPSLDFAGGTVVHVTSGVSALVTRALSGQAHRLPAYRDAAALDGAELYRRVPAVGGLVRIQCRQRAGFGSAGDQRIHQHAFCGGGRGAGLDDCGVDPQRQADGAGRHLRCGCRTGGDYAGVGICSAFSGTADRAGRRASSAPSWCSR